MSYVSAENLYESGRKTRHMKLRSYFCMKVRISKRRL